MHGERLTRQELTWLLTQEARSAAEKLRKGVTILSEAPPSGAPTDGVEALDALDDAMKMLANLHKGASARGRRGRIDVAALLWEVVPDARASIEPGSGTEVFGDEAELRRMLQVLVASAAPTGGGEIGAPEISIRREGNDVRISVTLGPDSAATASTERAWLSRMAIRYGGRLELEGGTESVFLPADGASVRRELEELRRELEAAQQQGEAYARELAAAFSHGADEADLGASPSTYPPPADPLANVTAIASALAAQLRGVLSPIARDAAALREKGGDALPLADAIATRTAMGSEIVAELTRIGDVAGDEPLGPADLAEALRTAVQDVGARASRAGVTVKTELPSSLAIESRPALLAALLRLLVDHAVAATPRGGSIVVAVAPHERGATIAVDDGGPAIPAGARRPLLALEADATALGRPAGIALYAAHAIAQRLGGSLALGDAPSGGTRVELTLT